MDLDAVTVEAPAEAAERDGEAVAAELAAMSPREIDERIVVLMREGIQARIASTRLHHSVGATPDDKAAAAALEQDIRDRLAPLNAEYERRLWLRYFIPTRDSVRVHTDRQCGTFKRQSVVSLLWQCSGLSAEDVLTLLGPVFCSQCYPGDLGPRHGITRRKAVELLDGL